MYKGNYRKMNNPKILYIAPLQDLSGYANAARGYVKALHLAGANLVTRHLKFDSGVFENDTIEQELATRDLKNVDVIIQHTTPDTASIKLGVKNILAFAWETSRLPVHWAPIANQFDHIIAFCEQNRQCFIDSGIIKPITVVPHTFDIASYKNRKLLKITNYNNEFLFYNICQFSNRKGVDKLLISYFTEFKKEDNVILLLKTYISSTNRKNETEKVRGFVDSIKKGLKLNYYPPVLINTEVLSDDDILDLHYTGDCFVSASTGEAWNICAFDAAATGNSVVATGWGGVCEFIRSISGWYELVDYRLEPVYNAQHAHPAYYTGNELWAAVDIVKFGQAMRRVYEMRKDDRQKLALGKENARDFDYSIIGPKLLSVINNVCKSGDPNCQEIDPLS